MSFVEDDHRFLGEFFGDKVSDLGVEEVVVAVDHNVGVQDLRQEVLRSLQGGHKQSD